jgi:hypothetical protein
MLGLFVGYIIGMAVAWIAGRAGLQDALGEWQKERTSLAARVQYLESLYLETEGLREDGTLGPTKENLLAWVEDLQDHLAKMACFISNQNALLEKVERRAEDWLHKNAAQAKRFCALEETARDLLDAVGDEARVAYGIDRECKRLDEALGVKA